MAHLAGYSCKPLLMPYMMYKPITLCLQGGFGGQPQRRPQQQQQQQRESANLYTASSPVASLSSRKFPGATARHVWLIKMYAPWCGHCKGMVSAMETLAKELSGVVKVKKHTSMRQQTHTSTLIQSWLQCCVLMSSSRTWACLQADGYTSSIAGHAACCLMCAQCISEQM